MKKRYEKELSIKELAALPDEDIDYSDIAPLDENFWKNAKVVYPAGAKKQLTLRLDPDILSYFKKQGRGYQTRMNAVLRAFVDAQNKQK